MDPFLELSTGYNAETETDHVLTSPQQTQYLTEHAYMGHILKSA